MSHPANYIPASHHVSNSTPFCVYHIQRLDNSNEIMCNFNTSREKCPYSPQHVRYHSKRGFFISACSKFRLTSDLEKKLRKTPSQQKFLKLATRGN